MHQRRMHQKKIYKKKIEKKCSGHIAEHTFVCRTLFFLKSPGSTKLKESHGLSGNTSYELGLLSLISLMSLKV